MERNKHILLYEDFTRLHGRWNDEKDDEFNSNIDKLKKIDLGSDFQVYFADTDLIVDGSNKFDWYNVETILTKIEKTGWRLPTYEEIQKMFYKGNQPPKPKDNVKTSWNPNKYGEVLSNETNEILYFETDKKYSDDYWANDDELTDSSKTARGFEVGNPADYYGCLIRTNNFNKEEKCKIRLVKDK